MISNISPSIVYIGVDDKDIDLFESQYRVPNGISYNSYLIVDTKIAIMDTVDKRKTEEWTKNLQEALNGRQPDFLVVQHMEPDHAGSIAALLEKYPSLKLVASAKAIQMLPQFFEDTVFTGKTIAMKEGDTLELGEHTLQFTMAPMVHWPEVMMTYDRLDKVVFTADAFGTFGTPTCYEPWSEEARRYYLNICGKYGMQVQSVLKKLGGLEINQICPLHGPVLKENLGYYIGLYNTWSKYEPETEGVLVAHASIHGGTAKAAEHLAEIIRRKGEKEVVVIDLCRADQSFAVSEAFRLSKMVVAGASYDADVFPPMNDFLHHLKLKGYQKRRVGIVENGSWAPTAGKVMTALLEGMKQLEIVEPKVTIRSTMKRTDEEAMVALAEAIVK